jgi:hypothetical protein
MGVNEIVALSAHPQTVARGERASALRPGQLLVRVLAYAGAREALGFAESQRAQPDRRDETLPRRGHRPRFRGTLAKAGSLHGVAAG